MISPSPILASATQRRNPISSSLQGQEIRDARSRLMLADSRALAQIARRKRFVRIPTIASKSGANRYGRRLPPVQYYAGDGNAEYDMMVMIIVSIKTAQARASNDRVGPFSSKHEPQIRGSKREQRWLERNECGLRRRPER